MIDRPLYYDKDGKPMALMAWAKRFEDMEYRRIDWTELEATTVSTVWLGLDHRIGDGPPLIFETMLIVRSSQSRTYRGGWYTGRRRYATIEQARAGHAEAVRKVRLGLEPEEQPDDDDDDAKAG